MKKVIYSLLFLVGTFSYSQNRDVQLRDEAQLRSDIKFYKEQNSILLNRAVQAEDRARVYRSATIKLLFSSCCFLSAAVFRLLSNSTCR